MILVFDCYEHFVLASSAERAKFNSGGKDVKTAFEWIVQNRDYHSVCLVDQFCKRLLLVYRGQDQLVVTLLPDIFCRWRIDILSSSHRTDFDSSIGDALGLYEFFVYFSLCLTLLRCLDKGSFISQSSVDIKIFCFNNVILFRFKKGFLTSLLQHGFLLKI